MKKDLKKLCLSLLIGVTMSATAQQTWYFGNMGGIKFTTTGGVTTTAPAPVPSSPPVLNSAEGTSTLVDGSNNVMMYSDGVKIWNGNGIVQVSGFTGDGSSTQGVQIVPIPSSPNRAFLFTLAASETTTYGNSNGTSGLRVSLVNIAGTAPSTTVTVVPGTLNQNRRLTYGLNMMSEKMSVTPDGKGGYWLVVHGVGVYSGNPASGGTSYFVGDQNCFYAYNITCGTTTIDLLKATEKKSIITNPGISYHQSWAHPGGNSFSMSGSPQFNGVGQMKIVKTSSSTAKLACVLPFFGNNNQSSGWVVNPCAQVYNMDLGTGLIDNATAKQFLLGFNTTNTFNKDGCAYGVEFSPNGNYLYVSSTYGSGMLQDMTSRIYQVDLTTAYPYTKNLVAQLPHTNGPGYGAMQIGPDNKIYVARPTKNFIDVISSPNTYATTTTSSVSISGTCNSGLPNLPLVVNNFSTPAINFPSQICAGQNITPTGSFTGQTPADHFWELYGSDASGNPVNAAGTVVSGGPSASWYNSQTWVDDVPGVFTFSGGTTLPCNKYYTIKLALTNGCGSWDEVIKTFYIQCYPNPVITSSVPNPVCYGTSINLCLNYTPGPGVTNDWSNTIYNYPSPSDNVSCINTMPNQNLVYTAGVSLNGCRSTTTYSVTAEQNNSDFGLSGSLPSGSSPYYSITATPVVTPPAGINYYWEVVQLDAAGAEVAGTKAINWPCWWTPGANVFWDYNYALGTGSVCPTGTIPGKFESDKKYKVTYGTWSNNCPWQSTSHTIQLTRSMSGKSIFVVEEVAPDKDLYKVAMTTTEDKNVQEGSLLVYPNPSIGSFQLECFDKQEKNITIYDVMGRLVYSIAKTSESAIIIDIADQPKGVYFIKVMSNGKTLSKKIIVE